jgi:hypothetical protein
VALGLVTTAVTTVLPLAPLLMVIVALLMAAVGTLDRSDLARWGAVPTAIGASAIAAYTCPGRSGCSCRSVLERDRQAGQHRR